jgi:Ca2+-binding RTX toxin-like protein
VLKLKDDVALDYETAPSVNVQVLVTARDSGNLPFGQSFTLTVADVDEGPTGNSIPTITLEQGAFQAPLNLSPLSDPEGQAVTYTVTALPGSGVLTLDGQALALGATLSGAQLAALAYSAPDDGTGATLALAASDGTTTTPYTVTLDLQPALSRTYAGTDAADRLDGAAGDDVVSGLGGDDLLYGGSGADRLDGGTGQDTMTGNAGDDTYVVDTAGDRVIEAANGGYDRVLARADYTLGAGQQIEALLADSTTGTAAINLTGNEAANVLGGSAGANRLDGGAGADTLYGYGGDDTYVVDNAADRVIEAAGGGYDRVLARTSYALQAGQAVEALYADATGSTAAIDLTGNEAANVILGSAGANVLNGKGGADLLQGLGGADTFAFDTALVSGNVDRIADFAPDQDRIRLSRSVFTALAAGSLPGSAFKDLSAGPADADDRVLYDHATGALYYDADGAGSGARVQFASLDNKAALSAADFAIA